MSYSMIKNVLTPDDIDFEYYLNQTETGEKIRKASEYLDQVMNIIEPPANAPRYPQLPFAGSFMDFRSGEVTLWAGENGSGKSMLQGQIMTQVCIDEGVCIASFEMKPQITLARIARQVMRHGRPNRYEVDKWLKSTDGKLYLYDQQGTVDPKKMIAVVKHCAERLGVKHIAIDSLMKCVKGEDDYNGQKDFVDQLTACARDYNVHIHLVAHMRKFERGGMPNKMDIKGTGAITDLVDNVLILIRNRKKEEEIEKGNGEEVKDQADAILKCDKQRNGNWEGSVKLWFCSKTSLRYTDRPEIA